MMEPGNQHEESMHEESEAGEETLFDRLGGEDAISAVVDAFCDLNVKDERVAKFFQNTNMDDLRNHQKEFLSVAFGHKEEYSGNDLRQAHAELGIEEEHFDAIAENLEICLKDAGVDEALVEEVMEVVGSVKNDVLGIDDDGEDGEGKNRAKKQLVTVTYELQQEHCDILKKHLAWVIEAVGSLEEAGQAIYDALFNNAGEGRKLFVSPKKVTAFRFITQIQRFCNGCDDVVFLDEELYNMGMRHIAYISPQQCKSYMPVFIGSITNVIKGVLDEEWSDFAGEAWHMLLSYIGGCLLRNLTEFSGKVHLIRRSWGIVAGTDTVGTRNAKLTDDDEQHDGDDTNLLDKKKKNAMKRGITNFGESLYFNLGVMSPEIAAFFKRSKELLAPLFGEGFGMLTELISDPNLLNEELYILAIRHLKYGTKPEHFPVFGQAVMVTLRSMLPRDWNWAHEDAWGWLWDTAATYLSKKIEEGHLNKVRIDETMDRLGNADLVDIGKKFYIRLFQLSDVVQDFFYKPNAMVAYIVEKVLEILSMLSHDPILIAHEIRALGMRHIKYNIPPVHFPLFGQSLIFTLSAVLEGFWHEDTEMAWQSVFDFVCRAMTRAVLQGSNLVTKAMVNNSVEELSDALDVAPRGVRDSWLLEVNVSGEIMSPFYWALYDGKTALSKFMLEELFTIRADRETYYCGSDNLFLTHPGLVKNVALLQPNLLPVVFDGLMWQSRNTDNGSRRCNYFIWNIYGDPTNERYLDPFNAPLAELVRLGYSELFTHPVTQFLVDVKWTTFARRMFIEAQLFYIVLLFLFMAGYTGFHWDDNRDGVVNEKDEGTVEHTGAMISRIALCVVNVGIIFLRQIPRIVREVKRHQVTSVGFWKCKVQIPISLTQPVNACRLLLNLLLLVSFLSDKELIPAQIDEDTVVQLHSWVSCLSAVLLWVLLFDSFSLDITLAKFKFQIGAQGTNLLTAMFMATLLIVGFGCAMTLTDVTHRDSTLDHFALAENSVVYLFAAFTSNYSYHMEMMTIEMEIMFVLYGMMSILLLLNLMSGMFTCTNYLQSKSIEGYTFLERGRSIVELESMCTLEKRQALWHRLKFTERIEFDEGDLGLSGGVQVLEPLSKRNQDGTTDDRIKRFPGEASAKIPWPVTEKDAKTVEEKINKLYHSYLRILKMAREMSKKSGATGARGNTSNTSNSGAVGHGQSNTSENSSNVQDKYDKDASEE